jgi:CRISPR-associated endonuclease/helicase Cas3
MDFEKIIAHKYKIEKTGKIVTQTLDDHILNVAIESKNNASIIGLGNMSYLIGLLHDVGKSSKEFQHYIWNETKVHVDHSSAGGKYIYHLGKHLIDMNKDKEKYYKRVLLIYIDIIIYVIQSHHGLFDVINMNEFEDQINRRVEGVDSEVYEEVLNYIEKLQIEKRTTNIEETFLLGFEEFQIKYKIIEELCKKSNSSNNKKDNKNNNTEELFYRHCFVRLMLSILKEADIYDSANASRIIKINRYTQDEIKGFFKSSVINIEEKYASFKKDNLLNRTRSKISERAKNQAMLSNSGSIQRLSMPTGAGKNLTALRYGIHNAHNHQKNRVFYITAFLSVLEQNAKVIKELLDNDQYVLEHHSNMIEDSKNQEEKNDETLNYNEERYLSYIMKKYLEDSFDSPVVLTTMVQYFNTLFKGKSSQIIRFSKMIHANIIIDEVQSIPIQFMYLFNMMSNFMCKIMKSNIILCSATQPRYDYENLDFPLQLNSKMNIVDVLPGEMEVFKRVEAFAYLNEEMSTTELLEFIEKQTKDYKSLLVILNTKKAVKTLYDALKEAYKNCECDLYYLTTNLCAAHRLDRINEIKRKLNKDTFIICVSTNLVEAGVDVDFNIVIRSLMGIDNLIQAAGRCNREGKLKNKGKLFIIRYKEEQLNRIKGMRDQVQIADKIFRECKNQGQKVDLEELQDVYYKSYYNEDKNNGNLMYYKCQFPSDTTAVDLLSNNSKYVKGFKYKHNSNIQRMISQSFKTAAQNINLIDNDTVGVIIKTKNQGYDNTQLISNLVAHIGALDYKNIKLSLRRLQPFTVNIYQNKLNELDGKCKNYLEQTIIILKEDYYLDEIGIDLKQNIPLENLIF